MTERNVASDPFYNWANETVEVKLITVLWAIRYGLGRYSYANADAHRLAWKHWEQFPWHIQEDLKRDIAEQLTPTASRKDMPNRTEWRNVLALPNNPKPE